MKTKVTHQIKTVVLLSALSLGTLFTATSQINAMAAEHAPIPRTSNSDYNAAMQKMASTRDTVFETESDFSIFMGTLASIIDMNLGPDNTLKQGSITVKNPEYFFRDFIQAPFRDLLDKALRNLEYWPNVHISKADLIRFVVILRQVTHTQVPTGIMNSIKCALGGSIYTEQLKEKIKASNSHMIPEIEYEGYRKQISTVEGYIKQAK